MDPARRVNPYIAGSPVTGTEMFFGREDVFSFVRRNLSGRHRDTPIVLYGQRRTGKTSVLYQMHRHLDPRYRLVFIDLHGLNLDGKANLLWGIASSIRRDLQRDHQLSVAIPGRTRFSANPEAEFEETFLDAVWSILGEDHLVLMIDEVVRLHEEVQAGRLEREVFDYLRYLMQHFDRLNFLFSLGSGVEEMKQDYAFLFSVALYHRISFLEPVAARTLITKPAHDSYQVTPDAVEKIMQITSGHPYYTQLVCHCLFDRWLRAPQSHMTSTDVEAVLPEAIELGSANLTYVWEDATREEQATMAGMAAAIPAIGCPATVDQIRKVWRKADMRLPIGEATNAVRNLTARDVIMASHGGYAFTVDLQRLWLDKHRRLDWVKEELAEITRSWNRPTRAETSEDGKLPVQRKQSRFSALSATGKRRRQLLIAAPAIAVAIAVAAAATVVLIRSAGLSPVVGARSSTPPSTRSVSPTQPSKSSPPPGWKPYHDLSGFSVELPAGWAVHSATRTGTYPDVDFTGPVPGFDLLISWSAKTGTALSSAQALDKFNVLHDRSYQLIRFSQVSYRSYNSAVWEFTDTRAGVLTHVIDLLFVVKPGIEGYGILLRGPQHKWSAVYRSMWSWVLATFNPAP